MEQENGGVATEAQPGTKEKKRIRLAVTLFYFAQGICFSSWASRIPDIKASLHLSEGQLGTVLLSLPVGQLLTMPFSGRLVTRFGSRKVMRIMAAAYAIQLTNIALATEVWQLILGLFVFGICGNMSNIAVNTQGVLAEKIYQRSIMASFHGAWSAAGFAGALLGLLMGSLSVAPYPHFWLAACIAISINLLFNRGLVQGGQQEKKESQPLFVKPNPVLIQLGIIGFCSMASEGAMFDWSGVYFKEVIQTRTALVPLGYACFMVMMAAGRFVGDKLILLIGGVRMMQICGTMISAGLLLSVLFPYLAAAIPGFMMVGFGVSIMIPSVYSAAGNVAGISPGRALAFTSGISYFGFLIGPPLIGYIAEISSLRYSYAVIAMFGVCITMMVSRMKLFVDFKGEA
jgi:MFS family permease